MEKRRSTRKVLYVLGGLATLCFGSGLVVTLVTGLGPYDLPAKARMLDEAIAESKRLGLPMTAAELAGPRPPDDQNAAIEAVLLAKEINKASHGVSVTVHQSEEIERRTREVILDQEKNLDKFAFVVSSRPNWYVERDYDLGPYLLIPEFADVKAATKLLATRAELKAMEGDVDGAIFDLRAVMHVSRLISRDPFLIAALVAIALDSIALRSVERIADSWHRDSAKLGKLEQTLLAHKHRIDPEPSLRGEFYMAVTVCRNLKAMGGLRAFSNIDESAFGEPNVDLKSLKRSGYPRDLFGAASMTTFAEFWNQVFTKIKAQDKPARGWSKTAEALVAEMQDRSRASEILADVLLPVFAQADRAMSKDDVNQDAALAFVRCLRFRAETGRFPTNLDQVDSSLRIRSQTAL